MTAARARAGTPVPVTAARARAGERRRAGTVADALCGRGPRSGSGPGFGPRLAAPPPSVTSPSVTSPSVTSGRQPRPSLRRTASRRPSSASPRGEGLPAPADDSCAGSGTHWKCLQLCVAEPSSCRTSFPAPSTSPCEVLEVESLQSPAGFSPPGC